jgi:hypothetical protein
MDSDILYFAELALRVIVGLYFLVFGLNGFLKKIPIPPSAPAMTNFVGALEATGYLMSVVKCLEILSGVLLVANFHVLLAIHFLAPIVFVIVSAQFFLNFEKGKGVLITTLIPYLGLVLFHFRELNIW